METESKHEHHLNEIDMEPLFRDEDDQWMDAAARAYEENVDEDDQWMDDAARAYEEKVAADDLPQPWPKIIDHEEYYGTDGGMPYFMRWAFFSRIAEQSNNPIDDTYIPLNHMKDGQTDFTGMWYLQYHYPGCYFRDYTDASGTPTFPAFNHCDFSTMPTLSPVYVQNEGYQSLNNIDGTIKVHHDKLNASTMLHLLSLVPDFELRSVRQRNLMSDLLKTVVRKKSTEDDTTLEIQQLDRVSRLWIYVPVATLEMHHSRVGRLWLYVPFTSFYQNLFDDLLNLRHARLDLNESAGGKPAAVRIHVTVSTIMILLARFSRDFEQPDFYAYVVNGFMMNAFENAMDKDQFALATIFSLFVPRNIVVQKCRDAYEKYHEFIDVASVMYFISFTPSMVEKLMNASALNFMSFVRGHELDNVDDETKMFTYRDYDDNRTIEKFLRNLFERSLSTRALGTLLNHGGIVEAFRLMANVDLPWSSNDLIVHRYFYGLIWRFLNNSLSAEKWYD